MNDFAEIENELRKLRPAQPSPILLERVKEGLAQRSKAARTAHARWDWRRLVLTPYNWGLAAAAAAILLLFAIVHMQRTQETEQSLAQSESQAGTETTSQRDASEKSPSFGRFIPAGETRMVYNTRDEGLHFASGSGQPLRRVRYQTHETWQWRNPTTGASLRVSYPSEEVVLIPVSGQ